MSAPEGLQFPFAPQTHHASTSHTGKQIISEALALVDNKLSQQVLKEKNWRKRYPHYFKGLVRHGILYQDNPFKIASQGLHKAHQLFVFIRDHQCHLLKDFMRVPHIQNLHTVTIKGQSQHAPEWHVPYHGQELRGQALLNQITLWEQKGIIEAGHAQALREVQAHPEWLDLSDYTMVLFGAGSEAGPLTWLSKWKAKIVAIDLPNEHVWSRILNTIEQGNATLIAPSQEFVDHNASKHELVHKLGANLLTQTPEIAGWLAQMPQQLNLAAIAYLDGEKHVRVAMAMDAIMQYVSEQKPDSTLMFMCTPTDVYAVPKHIVDQQVQKAHERSTIEKLLAKGVSNLSIRYFLKPHSRQLYHSNNGKDYAIADCLVLEQGPNYALAKRIQQWRAIMAREQGQHVCINIAPSTTTHSVTKNPLLRAAFNGAHLFNVEAFEPETTNALMAAKWIHDLRNPKALANPKNDLDHPLELLMHGANHGGMWNAAYLVRSALPFAAIYGLVADKFPINKK
ncbi:hypothetical protein [Acinetobacter sp. MB5]|uniref:hypothetical protein n=1 Tax=Acinetobacter sp. MB5 TaxID=2069438 RepID=UPI000DD0412B|nr:hypothetical protein [Acinetobacter sp. MB5]